MQIVALSFHSYNFSKNVYGKQASLTGDPMTLEQIKFQDFLNSMGLIFNSTILYIKV